MEKHTFDEEYFHRMFKLFASTVFIISTLFLYAQPDMDFNVSVPSSALLDDQNIQVYLPKSYHEGTDRYPVLYILDGQWFFLNGVAIQETLRGEELLPELIVIGVDYQSRAYHDSLHFNHWEALSKYVEEELTSFVDKAYRTTGERILFGWENPSYMTCELLFKASSAFSGYIVSNGGDVDDVALEAFGNSTGESKYLFIANSEKDIYTVSSSNELAKKLKANKPSRLKWEYVLFNQEIHESLAYTSLYQGLRFYYHNFGSKVFSGTKEFYDEGGLEALESYFEERGRRFDTDPQIDESTKNSLIWLAWKHDDFESFNLFMTEFDEVLSTRRYASAYWQNRFGQYYLKYNDTDHAVEYFHRGINEFSDERFFAELHAGLGTAYAARKEKAKARAHYRKAIKHAKANNSEQLEDYRQKLKNME